MHSTRCHHVITGGGVQLLLGYLPAERRLWNKTLAQKRALYQQFCQVCALNMWPRCQAPLAHLVPHLQLSRRTDPLQQRSPSSSSCLYSSATKARAQEQGRPAAHRVLTVQELIIKPGDNVPGNDHPLAQHADSQWHLHFQVCRPSMDAPLLGFNGPAICTAAQSHA